MAPTSHHVEFLIVCVSMATVVKAVHWEVTTVTANQTVDDRTTNDINIIIFGSKSTSPDLELNHNDEHVNGATNRYNFDFKDIGNVGGTLLFLSLSSLSTCIVNSF